LGNASITTTLDPYPGEMDRYADRLNERPGCPTPPAMRPKMRSDDDEAEQDDA
jgi:hypothetical protein